MPASSPEPDPWTRRDALGAGLLTVSTVTVPALLVLVCGWTAPTCPGALALAARGWAATALLAALAALAIRPALPPGDDN